MTLKSMQPPFICLILFSVTARLFTIGDGHRLQHLTLSHKISQGRVITSTSALMWTHIYYKSLLSSSRVPISA